jgi:tetratricopeptide (TPR) repeat protein
MKRILFIIPMLFISLAGYCQTENLRAQQYYNRAMDKVFRKDHKGAIADFSEAIKLDSSFIEAYENRGVVKYFLEDFSGAIDDYNKALEINPDDYNTCVRRGWTRFRMRDFTGAMEDFDRAVEGNPDDPAYHNARGEVRYKLQDYDGAIADFNMVIDAWYSGKDQRREAFFWRGLVKIDTGMKDSGCLDLNKSAKMGYAKAAEVKKVYCE